MQKPPGCEGCKLVNISQGFINIEGEATNGVALIGESAGYNEYIDALPFRPKGQAGSKLEEVFRLLGWELREKVTRNNFVIGNVVNCNPPGDKLAGEKWEQEVIEHCRPNLERVYNTHPHVKVTVALGNTALKALTGLSGNHSEKQSIQDLRGYVLKGRYGLVVPALHPAFLRRGKNHWTPLLVADIKKAMLIARGMYTGYKGHPSFVEPMYQTAPGLDEARAFYYRCKDSPRLPIVYDIETPMSANVEEDEREELEDSDITLVQFSLGEGEGIALPYSGEYIKIIDAVLSLSNVKAAFNNWNFDDPRLRAKGHKIEGRNYDLMWMFKHWEPSLPRGLQSVSSLFDFPFPWKHLYGSSLEWYGCADVDSGQRLLHKLPPLMKAVGVWEGYKRHVAEIHVVMDRARDKGIPVNDEKRLALEVKFKSLRGELHKDIQAVVPLEIRNIKPRRKSKVTGEVDYGYLTKDWLKIKLPKRKDENGNTVENPDKSIGEANEKYLHLSTVLTNRGQRVISFQEFLWRKYNLTCAEFEKVDETSTEKTLITRWCVIEEFKASSKQLIAYLKYKQKQIKGEIDELIKERDAIGGKSPEITEKIHSLEKLQKAYQVPLTLKTKKETTGKKELEEIFEKTGDKVLEQVVRLRSIDVNLSNYIPNWKPARDGSVHTTWGYTAPTGQFDSRSPNILNCSKHTEFGNEFRSIIEAPKGYVFVEFDKKSYHVGTMGYCANDKDYIRFSQIDPHSILGSYIDPSIIGCSISLKWSDADIKVAAKEFKKRCKAIKEKDKSHNVDVRQELAKPTVLGNQLGLGAIKLQHQNRKFIHYVYRRDRLRNGDGGMSSEELQSIVAELFPKEESFKVEIKNKAFVEKKLVDEFGRIQYFFDVYKFVYSKKENRFVRSEGEGAREPIAFRVQGTAFGALQLSMLEFERIGFNVEMNFINSIHDSLIFMPEVGKLDRCLEDGNRVLSMPCRLLVNDATGPEGLRIGTDASVGRNWSAWNKESNPEGLQEVSI